MSSETVRVDRYVVDVLQRDLIRHDGKPSAFLVYLHLATRGRRDDPVELSYADLAFGTGLSKSAVQAAVLHLKRRRLIKVERDHETATPRYLVLTPWERR